MPWEKKIHASRKFPPLPKNMVRPYIHFNYPIKTNM